MSLLLNCLIHGDDPSLMFAVEIQKNNHVTVFKDLIKEKKTSRLKDIDASDLNLWKADFPINDDVETELKYINLAGYSKLWPPSKKLSTFFTVAKDDYLHVIVNYPGMSH